MNKYETIFLISNQITEEQRKSIITKIAELISKNGTITNKEELGEKKLAYEIRKHTQAFYYIINCYKIPLSLNSLCNGATKARISGCAFELSLNSKKCFQSDVNPHILISVLRALGNTCLAS